MPKQIPLSNGGFAVVDDEDFEMLQKWRWYLGTHGYATRSTTIGGRRPEHKDVQIPMHEQLIGHAPPGQLTDHKNRNKLDNRRGNLRHCSYAVNALNTARESVFWNKRENAWNVSLRYQGKQIFCSNFKTKEEALSVAALLRGALIYHELTKGGSIGQ